MKRASLLVSLFLPMLSFGQKSIIYDTSKITGGNGIASRTNISKQNLGFETWKNYHLDGEFNYIDTLFHYSLSGYLKYQPDCVNKYPGVRGKYISENKDTISFAFDSSLFTDVFKNSTAKIIETISDSILQATGGIHPELNLGFGDPAVVPVGEWRRFDIVNRYVFAKFQFDDCGNVLIAEYYNPDGTLLVQNKTTHKPKTKRYWW